MVIVDRELLGKESEKEFEYSKVPLGIFLENEFQKNISEYGDANWLVRFVENFLLKRISS